MLIEVVLHMIWTSGQSLPLNLPWVKLVTHSMLRTNVIFPISTTTLNPPLLCYTALSKFMYATLKRQVCESRISEFPARPKLESLYSSYLLAYSLVQSPSWEANWFAASQEIPRISQNPKVHYHTHKRPPPVSTLCQPNPVHIPTSHLLEIHPNISHPFTPRSPQWSSSLRFPHQDPIHPPLLSHTRHMPSPSHSSRFYHPNNIGWGVQIIYLLIMQSSPVPTTFT